MKLGNFIQVLSGFAFESNLFNEENIGIPVVRIRDVGKKSVHTFYNGPFNEKYVIKKGDYLIGMDGDFRLAKWECENALLNQRVCKISVVSDDLDEKYLFHFLPKELKKIEDSTSFATVKHLSVKKIQDINIALPPLEAQKRVAQILDDAQALKQKTEQLLKEYDALAQSIFLDMFGNPITNSRNYILMSLIDVIDENRPITYGILKPGDDIKPEGVPYIKVVDVKDGRINERTVCHTSMNISNQYKRSILLEGDVLFSIRGHVGRVCLVPEMFEGANITQDTARLACNYLINKVFLSELLQNIHFRRNYQKFIKGAAVKGINLGDLKTLPIIVPPIALQNQFAEKIALIEKQKELARQELKESEDLFNCLLQKAFKGELI